MNVGGEGDRPEQHDAADSEILHNMVPLASFNLRYDIDREGFLSEFCAVGEPAIFEAVNHVWHSLNEPRQARCTAMGITSGTGGKGKAALIGLLRACLNEIVVVGHPLPAPSEFPAIEDWHLACMAAFEAELAREHSIIERYSRILDGRSAASGCEDTNVIEGPWQGFVSTAVGVDPNPATSAGSDPRHLATKVTIEPQ